MRSILSSLLLSVVVLGAGHAPPASAQEELLGATAPETLEQEPAAGFEGLPEAAEARASYANSLERFRISLKNQLQLYVNGGRAIATDGPDGALRAEKQRLYASYVFWQADALYGADVDAWLETIRRSGLFGPEDLRALEAEARASEARLLPEGRRPAWEGPDPADPARLQDPTETVRRTLTGLVDAELERVLREGSTDLDLTRAREFAELRESLRHELDPLSNAFRLEQAEKRLDGDTIDKAKLNDPLDIFYREVFLIAEHLPYEEAKALRAKAKAALAALSPKAPEGPRTLTERLDTEVKLAKGMKATESAASLDALGKSLDASIKGQVETALARERDARRSDPGKVEELQKVLDGVRSGRLHWYAGIEALGGELVVRKGKVGVVVRLPKAR